VRNRLKQKDQSEKANHRGGGNQPNFITFHLAEKRIPDSRSHFGERNSAALWGASRGLIVLSIPCWKNIQEALNYPQPQEGDLQPRRKRKTAARPERKYGPGAAGKEGRSMSSLKKGIPQVQRKNIKRKRGSS